MDFAGKGGMAMEIGAAIFFTDYSMAPTDLAVALEERGFDSLWVAEHSHIPATRRFSHPQGEAALTKEYYDVMDPFVTLSAAATVTKGLKLGTAICLVIQRDTIQTAKAVASLDQISKGRFLFGIGCGWNAEEMEDHGTVYEARTLKMREQIEAMKEIWTKDKPEYHGEIVDFPPMMTWPKPVQKPHPPVIVGGAFRLAARRAIRYGDGILPAAPSAGSGSPEEFMPVWRRMAEEAGRDPKSLSVTLGGAPEDLAVLRRNRDLGVTRMNVRLPPEKEDVILPILNRWAKLIPEVRA
jgi:probable F420-dependent oxidoreductase